LGEVRQRFIAGIAARDGFAALVQRQLARAIAQRAAGAYGFSDPGNEVLFELPRPISTIKISSLCGVGSHC
jgi:hypothetical protein